MSKITSRPVVKVKYSQECLRCSRMIIPGEAACVTRGGMAWLHTRCAGIEET